MMDRVMKFYESGGTLMVKDRIGVETLVVGRFMQRENRAKLSSYLTGVAEKLNAMEPLSDAMSDYLEEVEQKVQSQMAAEKFMDIVAF